MAERCIFFYQESFFSSQCTYTYLLYEDFFESKLTAPSFVKRHVNILIIFELHATPVTVNEQEKRVNCETSDIWNAFYHLWWIFGVQNPNLPSLIRLKIGKFYQTAKKLPNFVQHFILLALIDYESWKGL